MTMRKMNVGDVQALLADLCAQMGFSIAIRHADRFKAFVDEGAMAFAEAVLIAEGLRPEENRALKRKVYNVVSERFKKWEHVS